MDANSADCMSRHQFLKLAAGGAVAAALPCKALAQHPAAPQPSGPQTFIYKESGGCQIKADVYRAAGAGRKPALVWIHGGA